MAKKSGFQKPMQQKLHSVRQRLKAFATAQARKTPFIPKEAAKLELLNAVISQFSIPKQKVQKILPACAERLVITETMLSKRISGFAAKAIFGKAFLQIKKIYPNISKQRIKVLSFFVKEINEIPEEATIKITESIGMLLLQAAKKMNDKELAAMLGKKSRAFTVTLEAATKKRVDWVMEN